MAFSHMCLACVANYGAWFTRQRRKLRSGGLAGVPLIRYKSLCAPRNPEGTWRGRRASSAPHRGAARACPCRRHPRTPSPARTCTAGYHQPCMVSSAPHNRRGVCSNFHFRAQASRLLILRLAMRMGYWAVLAPLL